MAEKKVTGKGRTAWEILTGKNKPKVPAQDGLEINPLEVKLGGSVTVNTAEYGRNLFTVSEIWSWDRKINGKVHPMTDYFLSSADTNLLLRIFPRNEQNADVNYHVLAMTQYYPTTDGPLGWCKESPDILAAADDESGEFYNHKGEDNEETYWRVGGKIAIPCSVRIFTPNTEQNVVPYTLWDFSRETLDIADQKMIQFLYVQLSGKFIDPKTVNGGDRTIIMYRGEEVIPQNIMAF